MIVIKDIELLEVDYDEWLIHQFDPPPVSANPVKNKEYSEVTKEMVYGKEFVRKDGKRICIGATKEVQESIGIVFEAFDSMQSTIEEQYYTIGTYRNQSKELEAKIDNSSFWDRMKYLFTGKL